MEFFGLGSIKREIFENDCILREHFGEDGVLAGEPPHSFGHALPEIAGRLGERLAAAAPDGVADGTHPGITRALLPEDLARRTLDHAPALAGG